jgi:hypothetical protein
MAVRDVVVLINTASRLEAQQSSDTVRILGNSTTSEFLSIENSSGTSVFSLNAPSSSVTITGNLTASGDFSSSLASTASFGRIKATTLIGSAAGLTNIDTGTGIISSSAQIAANISGSFQSGFQFCGTIGKAVGVWSAGGALATTRYLFGGTGTQNAALSLHYAAPYDTEEYNGSNWSVGGVVISSGQRASAVGSQTAALKFGTAAAAEEYNGTAWAAVPNFKAAV